MKRRQFIRTSAAVSIAPVFTTSIWALAPDNKYRKDIGIQLYTLRNPIKEDLQGTIKAVAQAGYKQVEPYGFPNPQAAEMIKHAKDNGMAVNSSHFNWESVTNPDKKGVMPFSEVLDKAKEAGLQHLVIPYIHKHNRKNLDDYKRLAERCNQGAIEAKKAGIQLAYHNHAFEYEPKDGGKSGYQIFIEEFEPEMKFEVDVFWVKVGGVDPVKQIKALTGRVTQLHLKDLRKGVSLPSYGGVKPEDFKELGEGIIHMESVIVAADEAGVAHCHVEQDHSPDPMASVKTSMSYLKGL